MPVVEQQIQAPEPMTTQSSTVEVEQPLPCTIADIFLAPQKATPSMSTSGDAVNMRGGEYAGCECCGCGCQEGCC
ncbi:hypothetical protein LSUE1_G008788 [Lachnellula suecica]|uniref:Metallothionein n=1 Tax=Lachnellula suecica TaxID=602035 RepID=A0A8T9C1R0_9HELO|nr:hypothetical protein LSUE1_G008788 [Lachnellula suecica]